MERNVIVICEECGKKYRVDPDRIMGRAAGFSCRSCGHRIRVTKPDAAEAPTPHPPERTGAANREESSVAPEPQPFRRSGLGLQAKAWLMWFILPMLLPLLAGLLLVVPGGLFGDEALRPVLLMLALTLIAVLTVGLGYGLRLVDRVRRLAGEAERLAAGAAEPAPAPRSGDDLDRAAAAVRELGERLRSERGAGPRRP
jgi:DNA-directed RNA polymerase subunit RPC12/RpoP